MQMGRFKVSFVYILALVVLAVSAVTIFALVSRQRSFMSEAVSGEQIVNPDAAAARRTERELARKKSFFRREVVEAKVKSLFPKHDAAEIWRLLDEYVPRRGGGPERVQLAILKLSDGDVGKLGSYLEAAKHDYRDVLAQAEYPGMLRLGPGEWGRLSEAEKERISDEDVRQYLDWLGQ